MNRRYFVYIIFVFLNISEYGHAVTVRDEILKNYNNLLLFYDKHGFSKYEKSKLYNVMKNIIPIDYVSDIGTASVEIDANIQDILRHNNLEVDSDNISISESNTEDFFSIVEYEDAIKNEIDDFDSSSMSFANDDDDNFYLSDESVSISSDGYDNEYDQSTLKTNDEFSKSTLKNDDDENEEDSISETVQDNYSVVDKKEDDENMGGIYTDNFTDDEILEADTSSSMVTADSADEEADDIDSVDADDLADDDIHEIDNSTSSEEDDDNQVDDKYVDESDKLVQSNGGVNNSVRRSQVNDDIDDNGDYTDEDGTPVRNNGGIGGARSMSRADRGIDGYYADEDDTPVRNNVVMDNSMRRSRVNDDADDDYADEDGTPALNNGGRNVALRRSRVSDDADGDYTDESDKLVQSNGGVNNSVRRSRANDDADDDYEDENGTPVRNNGGRNVALHRSRVNDDVGGGDYEDENDTPVLNNSGLNRFDSPNTNSMYGNGLNNSSRYQNSNQLRSIDSVESGSMYGNDFKNGAYDSRNNYDATKKKYRQAKHEIFANNDDNIKKGDKLKHKNNQNLVRQKKKKQLMRTRNLARTANCYSAHYTCPVVQYPCYLFQKQSVENNKCGGCNIIDYQKRDYIQKVNDLWVVS